MLAKMEPFKASLGERSCRQKNRGKTWIKPPHPLAHSFGDQDFGSVG